MDNNLKEKLEAIIEKWLEDFTTDVRKQASGKWADDIRYDNMPFHRALTPSLSEFDSLSKRLERKFSTSLGYLLANCAKCVATEFYDKAEREITVSGYIPKNTKGEIDQLVDRLNKKQHFGDYWAQVKRIVDMEKTDQSEGVSVSHTVDLYLKKGNVETFFELKAPKPNKGQCQTMLRHSLYIHGIKKEEKPNILTYIGMAYNPQGEGNEYDHSFSDSNLDIKGQILMGKAYWKYLGEDDTYDELLRIIRRIGNNDGRERIKNAVLSSTINEKEKTLSEDIDTIIKPLE